MHQIKLSVNSNLFCIIYFFFLFSFLEPSKSFLNLRIQILWTEDFFYFLKMGISWKEEMKLKKKKKNVIIF